jgi:hypothetical protein
MSQRLAWSQADYFAGSELPRSLRLRAPRPALRHLTNAPPLGCGQTPD